MSTLDRGRLIVTLLRAPLSRGKGSLYPLARRAVECGVLKKVYIAVLAIPEALAQHFLSYCLSVCLTLSFPSRVPINFSSSVQIFVWLLSFHTVVQDTVHSSPLTTLIYCPYPACRIVYTAALCAPRSQNSLPGRSTVTTRALRSTPYPVVQWISGVLSETVKRLPCSANVENEWCYTFALPECLHDVHADLTVLNKGLFQGG